MDFVLSFVPESPNSDEHALIRPTQRQWTVDMASLERELASTFPKDGRYGLARARRSIDVLLGTFYGKNPNRVHSRPNPIPNVQLCTRRVSQQAFRGTSPQRGAGWQNTDTDCEDLLDTTLHRRRRKRSGASVEETLALGNLAEEERPWTTGKLELMAGHDSGPELEGSIGRPWSAQMPMPSGGGSSPMTPSRELNKCSGSRQGVI